MNFVKHFFKCNLLLSLAFCFNLRSDFSFKSDNGTSATLKGKIAHSAEYSSYATLLNNNVDSDQTFVNKTKLDLTANIKNEDIETQFGVFTKAVWGNPKAFKTSETSINDNGYVGYAHSHEIKQLALVLKEVWIDLNLSKILPIKNSQGKHSLKIGAFPFQLGRGIALGDAYASAPTSLGFYNDNGSDQYAFGLKFSNDIVKDIISLDLYGAILKNKSTSISETAAQIYAQSYDGLTYPQRGFGSVEWLVASRLLISPINNEVTKLNIEPYAMYVSDPEQSIEFLGDANSKLGTVGCAVDLSHGFFEFGCESAFNFGRQEVLGWDRNVITRENRSGVMTNINSHVYFYDIDTGVNANSTSNTNQIYYTGTIQKDISNVVRSQESNGATIDSFNLQGELVGIANSKTRFTDPYTNTYDGYMFVSDILFWLYQKDLSLAFAGGMASGDQNPNKNMDDALDVGTSRSYGGFIGLQEYYSGKTVQSIYVMGSRSMLKRPLSLETDRDKFAQTTDGFSNLQFAGLGLKYARKNCPKQSCFKPNVIAFWAHDPSNCFDINTQKSVDKLARKYLGLELNLISSLNLTKDLTLESVTALFVPGDHYEDIKGKPFSSSQRKALDSFDPSGTPDKLPVVSSDVSYFSSIGLSYKF